MFTPKRTSKAQCFLILKPLSWSSEEEAAHKKRERLHIVFITFHKIIKSLRHSRALFSSSVFAIWFHPSTGLPKEEKTRLLSAWRANLWSRYQFLFHVVTPAQIVRSLNWYSYFIRGVIIIMKASSVLIFRLIYLRHSSRAKGWGKAELRALKSAQISTNSLMKHTI